MSRRFCSPRPLKSLSLVFFHAFNSKIVNYFKKLRFIFYKLHQYFREFMRILLQRVSEAQVTINNQKVAQINQGLTLFLGIHKNDQIRDADYLVEKCLNLRIFADENGKMNRSVIDIQGAILLVSQFTLYADTRKGRRPGFSESAHPEIAIPLYEYVITQIKSKMGQIETGQFGADMKVDLINDGPVTIMIDSEDKYPKLGIDHDKR